MRWVYLSVIVLAALPAAASSTVWYVDKASGAPAPDGSSWATAFAAIEPAITAASAGDEIWVAKGTYDEARGGPLGALLLKSGVSLYGGFAGAETAREQRDWAKHETIIDGSAARGGAHAYHVVLGADALTLDGFTIDGGYANDVENGEIWGGGLSAVNIAGPSPPWTGIVVAHCTFRFNNAIGGGAIYSYYVPLTIEDCVFLDNGTASTTSMGGAIMTFQSATAIRRCRFRQNGGPYVNGGAVLIDTGPYEVSRCRFEANLGHYGAGIYIDTNPGGTIANCLFCGNLASIYSPVGGGVCVDNSSSATVTNCTFYGNQATDGGALCTINGSSATITNCIAWNNVGTYQLGGANLTVNYCDIEDVPAAGTSFSLEPAFYDSADQDFRLRTDSPCRNSGTSTGAPGEDLDGAARPKEGAHDIGAIEMPETFFVSKPAGKPVATGRSWATAFSTIQEGADAAAAEGGGEVWVSAGLYNEPRASARGAVTLTSDVALLGGFAGTETSALGRDWETNATVIDGSTALSGGQAFNVVWAGNRATLDGCIVTGGMAHAPYSMGGGIIVEGSSVRVANCRIEYNSASDFGGGAALYPGTEAHFENCSFRHNTANGEGGGCDIEAGASAVFSGCRFESNTSNIGGAVNAFFANPLRLESCLFAVNQGVAGGGAVCVRGGSSQTQNGAFFGNAGSTGSAYYLKGLDHQLEHVSCIGNLASISPLIALESVHSCDIRNSILWQQASSAIGVVAGTAPTVTFSDVKGLNPLGDTNIDADPQVAVSAANGILLRTGSPCIDTAATLPHLLVDLRGVARPQHGACDMGAYEMRPFTLHLGVVGSGTLDPPAGDHTIFEQDSALVWAYPNSGWYWSEWQGDVSSTVNGAAIVMDSDKSVTAVFKRCKLVVKWPNGGETLEAGERYGMKWKCQGDTGSTVRIDLVRKGSVVAVLQTSTPNDGAQRCRIPNGTPAADGYRIRVTSTEYPEYSDMSNNGVNLVSSK